MFVFSANICNEIINMLLSSIFSSCVRKNFKKTKLVAFLRVSQHLIASAALTASIAFSVKGFARL